MFAWSRITNIDGIDGSDLPPFIKRSQLRTRSLPQSYNRALETYQSASPSTLRTPNLKQVILSTGIAKSSTPGQLSATSRISICTQTIPCFFKLPFTLTTLPPHPRAPPPPHITSFSVPCPSSPPPNYSQSPHSHSHSSQPASYSDTSQSVTPTAPNATFLSCHRSLSTKLFAW